MFFYIISKRLDSFLVDIYPYFPRIELVFIENSLPYISMAYVNKYKYEYTYRCHTYK